jgi:LAO/AO transport system kinase
MTIDFDQLISGDVRTLAKAITLIESKKVSDQELAQELITKCLLQENHSIRIGISGVPGVGKSTFIENFGLLLCESGHKVAVLAVDPSSPIHGGSILGDKTRMENLARHPNAFIRPSPSSGHLGGVGAKTREAISLVEASGFDVILIETVGVGQSEFAVKNMVDFFLLLMLPGGGDEVQGIKKGIMEMTDLLVINKADGKSESLAKLTAQQYETALAIIKNSHEFSVLTCSALKNVGLKQIWENISASIVKKEKSGEFIFNRNSQNVHWMRAYLHALIEERINKERDFKDQLEQEVTNGKVSPLTAAKSLFSKILD